MSVLQRNAAFLFLTVNFIGRISCFADYSRERGSDTTKSNIAEATQQYEDMIDAIDALAETEVDHPFRSEIEAMQRNLCFDILSVLSELVKNADTVENKAFYNMKSGEYFNYLIKVAENEEKREEYTKLAKWSYSFAYRTSKDLPSTNLTRLRALLKYIRFSISQNLDQLTCELREDILQVVDNSNSVEREIETILGSLRRIARETQDLCGNQVTERSEVSE